MMHLRIWNLASALDLVYIQTSRGRYWHASFCIVLFIVWLYSLMNFSCWLPLLMDWNKYQPARGSFLLQTCHPDRRSHKRSLPSILFSFFPFFYEIYKRFSFGLSSPRCRYFHEFQRPSLLVQIVFQIDLKRFWPRSFLFCTLTHFYDTFDARCLCKVLIGISIRAYRKMVGNWIVVSNFLPVLTLDRPDPDNRWMSRWPARSLLELVGRLPQML